MEDQILEWFSHYAYQPGLVYTTLTLLMIASSFGLPFPEEVTIVGASLTAYMASHPDLYPPPEVGAVGVSVLTLGFVAFFSVFISDLFIFEMGRFFGDRILNSRVSRKYMTDSTMGRVKGWITKYGLLAPCIFRFTPGLRFPGHMMCGVLGISRLKFMTMDGLAALISVPTQVILIAAYGKTILSFLSKAKIVVAVALVIIVIVYIVRNWLLNKK